MTGKKYLDDEFGEVRGNGNGISGILDDFADAKIKEEIIPKLKLIKERARIEYVKFLAQELIDEYSK